MSADFNKKTLVLALLITGIITLRGDTINVQTPVTAATIQTAVNNAEDGDVVVIPACNVNIDSQINLKEGIHVCGAGKDLTTLNKTSTANWSQLFRLNAVSGKPFKISGISFVGKGLDLFIADNGSLVIDYGISIFGKAQNFEIYDCRFSKFSGCGIYVYGSANATLLGHATGVIHDNEFKDIYYKRTIGDNPTSRGYGVGLYGDDGWSTLQLGTGNAVFVEDNYFEHNRHCIADNMGARYVFRHNDIVDNYYPFAAIDAHGTTIGVHGSRSYEIYENTVSGGITWDNGPGTAHATWAIGIRGGDGVIFNNNFYDSTKAMYTDIEGYDGTNTPDPDRTTDQWIWNNTLDDVADNTMWLGWDPANEALLDDYLIKGTHIHEDAIKVGYSAFTYPHPLRNIMAHWTLDNNTVVVDSSCSGNNGAASNTSTVSGKCNSALDFNGTSSYAEIPYNANLNTATFTVSAWVKPHNITTTNYQAIVSSRNLSPNLGYVIYLGSDHKWQFWTYNSSGTTYNLRSANVVPAADQWYHVVATYDGSTKKLYVDGSEVATQQSFSNYAPNTSKVLRIGASNQSTTPSFYFDGLLDDVRIFSKALTQTEILDLYHHVPDPSFENGLSANPAWSVRNGSPTTDTGYNGSYSIHFNKPTNSTSTETSIKMNNYIPVTEGKSYIISAWAKGNNIVQGDSTWHKFYASGRWYDKNMTELSTADLPLGTGTYAWTLFENPKTAPANAAYYRATSIGILQTGTGEGWIDMFSIRPVIE